MIDETTLFEKLMQKDEQAFSVFIHKYIKLFYKIVQRILNSDATHEEIMDCLSESYIYIWYHLDKYNPDKCSFRNWCSLIVINRAKNRHVSIARQRNKVLRIQEHFSDDHFYEPSAEDVYMENVSEEIILEKIDELPSPAKDVFKQRYVDGLKPKQIAKNLSITTKQVDNHLAHAKRKLRKGGLAHDNE